VSVTSPYIRDTGRRSRGDVVKTLGAVAHGVEYQLVDLMLEKEPQAPRISRRARRFITATFVLNILAVMVLLAIILPAGNKAILYKVQNLPTPWCQPFGCDRG
jgi:hypothetical protein